jgi:hypothetical protein
MDNGTLPRPVAGFGNSDAEPSDSINRESYVHTFYHLSAPPVHG